MFNVMHGLTATAGVALILAVVGCSESSTKAPEPEPPYGNVGKYCTGLAQALCSDKVANQCPVDKAKCVANLQSLGYVCPSQNPGTFRPAAAETCINAVKAATADGHIEPGEQKTVDQECGSWWNLPQQPICNPVFTLKRLQGEACETQCDCDLDGKLECINNKCAIPVVAKVGSDCSSDNALCEPGNYCSANDKKCVNNEKLSRPCSVAKPCEDSLRCDISATTADAGTEAGVGQDAGPTTGTCAAKLALGDLCESDEECSSGLCQPGPGGDGGTTWKCGGDRIINGVDPICIYASK
jgi:hypothetical protein